VTLAPDAAPLLRIEGLTKHFPQARNRPPIRAVDGVSFSIGAGETLALVGETGCGKSTIARTLVRLIEPTRGRAVLEGDDLFALSLQRFRAHRRKIQMVFQDPSSSLNPRRTVRQLVTEAWSIYPGMVPAGDRGRRLLELLDQVGISPNYVDRFPHQLSGGQRQRVAIARALAVRPKVIICDEPVSSLDASVQAQVLNLFRDLQTEFGVAYLFITHDLAAVSYLADRIAVMYLGKLVEVGTREQILNHPVHPYTQALVSANPDPDTPAESRRSRIVLTGDVPSPADPPSGCTFRTRCWKAATVCADDDPLLEDRGHGHASACLFAAPRP
jgi:oligopeptide transport system ATP-binding protein